MSAEDVGALIAFTLVLSWPVTGWACAYFSIPAKERDDFFSDPLSWVLLVFCGALLGPIGIVWFWLNADRRG